MSGPNNMKFIHLLMDMLLVIGPGHMEENAVEVFNDYGVQLPSSFMMLIFMSFLRQ